MIFGGEIERMEITTYPCIFDAYELENLSEFGHFISNHCYINSIKKS
jgi:hypothetical protein